MTTYIALFNLTDAGIKAAKDSPRRLDAAKKLLADMGGEMKQFYMVMGEFDFVGICEAPDDAVMAVTASCPAREPRLRAHEDAEGVPGDRLPRNHPLARLSRVGCSWQLHARTARPTAKSSCGSLGKLDLMPYDGCMYYVEQCDVPAERRSRVAAFQGGAGGSLWLSWLHTDEVHPIWPTLHTKVWGRTLPLEL